MPRDRQVKPPVALEHVQGAGEFRVNLGEATETLKTMFANGRSGWPCIPPQQLDFADARASEASDHGWFIRLPERPASWPSRLVRITSWFRPPAQHYARLWRTDGKWFAAYVESARDYITSELPLLRTSDDRQPPDFDYRQRREDVLAKLYGEVGAGWRMLTDVRFKLMTLLPTVSLVAWGTLLSSDRLSRDWSGSMAGAVIAVIGFWITRSLRIYDRRNDELYDDLISRGRRIEYELGVHTGIFLGRRRSRPGGPNHGVVSGIYSAAQCGWVLVIAWFLWHLVVLAAAPASAGPGDTTPALGQH